MCIGVPMRVRQIEGVFAVCEGRGETRRLDMSLLGERPAGSWVLAYRDWAQQDLDEASAAQINDALDALDSVMRGEMDIADKFADLIGREPELPEFLRKTA
ncbi:MAG: HypC/HybG/HupF family hydrogenase formation chaperone [Sulfuricella sp.]|nr:HypC/HybG/HupF family hydrogenase formation chaperone [Sulfuricella sp.]